MGWLTGGEVLEVRCVALRDKTLNHRYVALKETRSETLTTCW